MAVGFVNALRRNKLLTIQKQYDQLMTLAKTVFPRAELIIPLIPFSHRLAPEIQNLLKNYQRHLKRMKRIRFQKQSESNLTVGERQALKQLKTNTDIVIPDG